MKTLLTLDSNNRITIPKDFRRKHGLKSGDRLLFKQNDDPMIVLVEVSGNVIAQISRETDIDDRKPPAKS